MGGGPAGQATTKLKAAASNSLVIGPEACDSWDATASTTGIINAIGAGALKNVRAGQSVTRIIAIGRNALAGITASQNMTGNVAIGASASSQYSPGSSNVYIGDLICDAKPTSSSDNSSVKIGSQVQQLATQTGGSRQVLIGANVMRSATCTFAEGNGAIMIGNGVCQSASGGLSFANIFMGQDTLLSAVFGTALANTVIGGGTLNGAGASLACNYATCVGGGTLIGAGAGLGTDDVLVGGRQFTANVAPLNANLTCLGASQTGVPNASEVMIGRGCTAAGVTGKLSFGNAMEAVAATATAGAATLPANPVAFIPIRWNGTDYRFPVYNP